MSLDLSAWREAVRLGVGGAGPAAGPFATHVHVLDTTGSTNDDVARAAQVGAPEGYTVIAAEQTAGRGRRGATWFSPPAHGLYMSTLLRPDGWLVSRDLPDNPATSLITLMAGVAVASAIADVCRVHVELKWPNDVMARTPVSAGAGPSSQPVADVPWRKLAGILAEGASDGGPLRTVVLGIGLNVARSSAPPEVAARMIALDELDAHRESGTAGLLRQLLGALLVRLSSGVSSLSSGRVDEVRQAWRGLAPSVAGTRVRWLQQGTARQGRACGIDDSGALRVSLDDGGDVTVHGGEVEWLLDGGAHEV